MSKCKSMIKQSQHSSLKPNLVKRTIRKQKNNTVTVTIQIQVVKKETDNKNHTLLTNSAGTNQK